MNDVTIIYNSIVWYVICVLFFAFQSGLCAELVEKEHDFEVTTVFEATCILPLRDDRDARGA